MFDSTNWIAVLVASLATMALGFIWYNPKTFGTAWMKGARISMDDAKKSNLGLIMFLSFLMAFTVSAFLSTWVHEDENLPEFFHGAFHGMMLSLFVAIPWGVMHALYEQKSWQYVLINALYVFLSMCIMGGILFCMPGSEVAH